MTSELCPPQENKQQRKGAPLPDASHSAANINQALPSAAELELLINRTSAKINWSWKIALFSVPLDLVFLLKLNRLQNDEVGSSLVLASQIVMGLAALIAINPRLPALLGRIENLREHHFKRLQTYGWIVIALTIGVALFESLTSPQGENLAWILGTLIVTGGSVISVYKVLRDFGKRLTLVSSLTYPQVKIFYEQITLLSVAPVIIARLVSALGACAIAVSGQPIAFYLLYLAAAVLLLLSLQPSADYLRVRCAACGLRSPRLSASTNPHCLKCELKRVGKS